MFPSFTFSKGFSGFFIFKTKTIMALQLSFQICQSNTCDALTFVETTGAYNAISNPNGWGTPNATLGGVTSALLDITLANGNSYTIDLLATTYFPTDNSTFEYELTNSDFGYTDGGKITDQIIKFVYTVIANGTTYVQTVYKAFYCQVQCCVYSMFKDLNVTCDACSQSKTKAIDAYLLLKGLIYSANCGNTTNFNSQLATLQKLCLGSSCQNCK